MLDIGGVRLDCHDLQLYGRTVSNLCLRTNTSSKALALWKLVCATVRVETCSTGKQESSGTSEQKSREFCG